jgi:ATP synthase protein I
MMEQANNTRISRAFRKAARWQIIITGLVSGLSLPLAGVSAAISAALGGASVIAGGYSAVLMSKNTNNGTPGAVLLTLLKAEAVKIVVIAVLLFMSFKLYQALVPLYLIGGLAASALASGAGLKDLNNENE